MKAFLITILFILNLGTLLCQGLYFKPTIYNKIGLSSNSSVQNFYQKEFNNNDKFYCENRNIVLRSLGWLELSFNLGYQFKNLSKLELGIAPNDGAYNSTYVINKLFYVLEDSIPSYGERLDISTAGSGFRRYYINYYWNIQKRKKNKNLYLFTGVNYAKLLESSTGLSQSNPVFVDSVHILSVRNVQYSGNQFNVLFTFGLEYQFKFKNKNLFNFAIQTNLAVFKRRFFAAQSTIIEISEYYEGNNTVRYGFSGFSKGSCIMFQLSHEFYYKRTRDKIKNLFDR